MNEALCEPYRFLKVGSQSPIYFFSSWFGLFDVNVASYTILAAWQFWFIGQVSFLIQLHALVFWFFSCGVIMLLLWALMVDFILGIQL